MKVILITGASSGFGKSMARALVQAGHTVYGTSRYAHDDFDGVHMLRMDVTNDASVRSAVAEVLRRSGYIDVLINNAGMGIGGAVELATDDEIFLQLNTNFGGVVRVCRAVLSGMRERRAGLIINMSSIAGVFAVPYQGFYSASKSTIERYSEALTLEMAQKGVRTVIVEPGDFKTGFTQARRISDATIADADYGASFQRVLRGIEHDEQNGCNPQWLAQRIVRIVNCRHPHLRYVVATPL